MKSMTNPQNACRGGVRGKVLLAVAVAVSSLLPLRPAEGAVLTFEPDTPRVLVDFENLEVDAKVSTIGWTLSGASSIAGAAPRLPTSNPSGVVLQETGTTKQVTGSPSQSVNPAFTTADTVYFSGWFNVTGSASSGARVSFRDGGEPTSNILGGFGIQDSGSNPFSLYANGSWHFSSEIAHGSAWYEIALVVEMNPTDVSLSLGSLFVRNVTAGETKFKLIEDLSGIVMGYTDNVNATDFVNWRIDNFRNLAQVDNLAAGLAVIPEPGTVSLHLMGLLLLAFGYRFRRLSRKHASVT